MSDYQSLARKFRPQTFEEVCQQQAIVITLKNAISLNRVSHAYLFSGPRGVGKTTLARLFAKALNCHALEPSFEPCNNCSSCKEITAGQSLDVLEIDGASNRGIDDIRQLNETVFYTPSSSKYKIYIIDEVHMLTKEAFNALLKTLEEPPKHVKFFFATTEPHKVLPTILSRCQRFDLQRISLDYLCLQLKKNLSTLSVSIEEEALYTIAKCADGSLRDAQSLLDQMLCMNASHITFDHVANLLGLASKEAFFVLDEAFNKADLTKAFQLASTLYEEGKDLSYFLEMLCEHYQIILKHHLGLSKQLTAYDEKLYTKAVSIYSKEQCLYILDYLIEWTHKFQKMGSKKIHLELILMHIIRSKKRVSIDYLVDQLTLLKQSQQECTQIKIIETKLIEPEIVQEEIYSLPEKPMKEESSENFTSLEEEVQESIIEKMPMQETPSSNVKPEDYETILRFASVELNGVLKK